MINKAATGSMPDSFGHLFTGGTLVGLGELDLLDRFIEGDLDAFEAIVRQHGPMVLGVCRRVLDDPNDVDDAWQATFALLVQKARAIRQRDSLGAWLHGVARRVATGTRVEARRRRARERVWAASASTAESQVVGPGLEELRRVLDDELARLPERYRTPLVLCDLEGQTHEAAASQLRCPVGTIKSRLSRARERLRLRLCRRGLDPTTALTALLPTPARISIVADPMIRRAVQGAAGLLTDGPPLTVGTAGLFQRGIAAMAHAPLKLAAVALLATGFVTSGVWAFRSEAQPEPIPQAKAASTQLATAPPPPTEPPPVERFVLANGLTVILRPIQGAREMALVVLYAIGGDHDPAGQSGLAHLAEHVYLTAAAGTTPARTIADFGSRYPSGANGQTGDRYTVFATTFPATRLDDELKDAATRMSGLRITPADLDQEKPRLLQEIANMFGDNPDLAIQNNARELVRPTPADGRHGGTAQAIQNFQVPDIQGRLNRYYRPRNAIVALVGSFNPTQARQKIEAHFATLAPGEPIPPALEPGPPRFGTVQEVASKRTKDDLPAVVCLAYLAPRTDDPLYASFLVLIGRLRAGSAQIGLPGASRYEVYFTPLDDGAVVALSISARTNETPQQGFDRLQALVAEAINPPLRDGEADQSKHVLGSFFQTLRNPDRSIGANPYGIAFALGRRAQLGIDPARFNQSFQGVTEATLRQAATQFFDPARHAGAFVKP